MSGTMQESLSHYANSSEWRDATCRLYYTQPAEYWESALPLGNGRLGAMIFGGAATERVALNEDTLWSGLPGDLVPTRPPELLARARKLIHACRFTQADAFLAEHYPHHDCQSYQPAGDLLINFQLPPGEVSDYHRELRLDDAEARSEFKISGVTFRRSAFIGIYPVTFHLIYGDQQHMLSMQTNEHIAIVFNR